MISRLEGAEITSIRLHFDTPDLRLVVDSMISGLTPARVWADDKATPRTVLAWEGRCCYIVGHFGNATINKALSKLFSTEIAREGRSGKLGFFKLSYSPNEWSRSAEEIFGQLKEKDVPRRIYCSVASCSFENYSPSLPRGLELRQIDVELLESGLAHVDSVKDDILGGWPSLDTFLERGFGITLLVESSVVSWCTAEYVSEDKCGMGIETIKEYEGRGFATIVASEFVRHSLTLGVRPYWDCWVSNKPSVRVAEKVGFTKAYDYKMAIGAFADD